jgi:benzoyl-CoA reductase/2-hydroxyglutaryl-CoA dehydratase subunit BcrC/BadD/HgdB
MKVLSNIQQACAARREAELASVKRDRAAGRKIAGYTCHIFPAAVAAGLGMRPVRLLCGASAESESWGEQVVRADVCPHVKSLLGNASRAKDLHGGIDRWIGLLTCDQMRRGMAALAGPLGKEVASLHVPATRTPEAGEYYALQMRKFVEDCEERDDRAFDQAAARAWQDAFDQATAVLARAAWSATVSPLDLHHLFHLLFISEPKGLAEFFADTLAEAEPFRAKRTAVLTGSPLAYEDTVLLEDLEQRGIAVIPLNCTGLNSVEDGPDRKGPADAISGLALRAFRRPACMRARPNAEVYDRIRGAIARTGAAGVIMKSLTFCDHWYTERERMRNTFGLPVLVFDSDYAAGGNERLLSRIDAFAEMLS